jgi:hypothetical protein
LKQERGVPSERFNGLPLRLVGAVAVAGVLYLLWPMPNEEFLYRNVPELRGRVTNLKGASIVGFIDPAFFYRGAMQAADVDDLIDKLKLAPRRPTDFDATAFRRNGPLFWHAWWWSPQRVAEPRFYVGERNGNIVYLLRDAAGTTVYLYIQNT